MLKIISFIIGILCVLNAAAVGFGIYKTPKFLIVLLWLFVAFVNFFV